jgi:hypothetical protein
MAMTGEITLKSPSCLLNFGSKANRLNRDSATTWAWGMTGGPFINRWGSGPFIYN